MDIFQLISDCVPYVLSIIATIVAFRKNRKTLTADEIEAKAEEKKQKLLLKLNKKNHIKSDFQSQNIKASETVNQDNTSGFTTL